jgi:hypothetical protein
MKYTSAELSIDHSVVRLTFDSVPEGYDRFRRVTIHADDLFALLVHVDERRHEDIESSVAMSRNNES